MVTAILRMKQVDLNYGETNVLRNISLAIHPGEVVGVVGPNGVGKSTLVNAFSGVHRPHAGNVLLHDRDVYRLSPELRAREIAVVAQASAVPQAFTALEVVLMGRTPYLGWLGKEKAADYALALQGLQRTGTAELAQRRMGEMSGGERQRVFIARALAQTPSVLLLDEPTAHLDLRHQDEVLKLVRSLALQEHLAVLLCLHDLNLVSRFTDRVALLSDGAIRRLGNPAEVLQPDILAEVYGLEIHVVDHPLDGTPLVLA